MVCLQLAAIFFDQDPAQSVTPHTFQQVMGGEAATLRLFYLVSAVSNFERGWEETAVSMLTEPPKSLMHASAQLLQAERAIARA